MKNPFTNRATFRAWLAGAWTVYAMVYILLITYIPIPPDSIRFADTILGFLLGTIVATIINYFLGSSHDKDKKNEHFEDLETSF